MMMYDYGSHVVMVELIPRMSLQVMSMMSGLQLLPVELMVVFWILKPPRMAQLQPIVHEV
jgi:hypothetical protein